MPRALKVLDLLAGLLIAGSVGVWLVTWNLDPVTGADALFLPSLAQDIHAQGLGVLKTWHYGSSSFVFPDLVLFAMVSALFPHFTDAIPIYSGGITAATAAALWLVMKPAGRGSFAVFSAVLSGVTALYIGLMCVPIPYLVVGWYRAPVLGAHHYGNLINALLALAVFLWWRRTPSARRLAILTLVVLVGVVSDLLFVVSFVPAAILVDAWLREGTLVQWLRKRWSLPASFTLATVVGFAADALVNPLNPMRVSGPKLSALTALVAFFDVRFGTREQALESAVLGAFLAIMVVVARRGRRAARSGVGTAADRAAHERTAAIHGFFLLAMGVNVAVTIATGKYIGWVVDRYILTLAFFPLFSVFGILAARLAKKLPQLGLVTAGIALLGIVSLWRGKLRDRFELVEPSYVACVEKLGLAGSAGFAPYWLAKPLVMFTDRRVQVVQILPEGQLYNNLVNEQWAAQDWFGKGPGPQLRFALMASDARHSRMVDGEAPFEKDGLALDPISMDRAYGAPEAKHSCEGATIWTYRTGQLVGREPIRPAALVRFPLRLRAIHAALRLGFATIEDDQVRATGKEGNVLFGPYMALPEGKYRVRWTGTALEAKGKMSFDVVESDNPAPLAQVFVDLGEHPPAEHELATLHFELSKKLSNGIEMRVFNLGGAMFTLDDLVIERE